MCLKQYLERVMGARTHLDPPSVKAQLLTGGLRPCVRCIASAASAPCRRRNLLRKSCRVLVGVCGISSAEPISRMLIHRDRTGLEKVTWERANHSRRGLHKRSPMIS